MNDPAVRTRRPSDHRSSFVVALVSAIVLTLVIAPGLAAAQDDADPPQGDLPDGEWLGSLDAAGKFTESFDGVDVEVDTRLGGSIGFDITDGTIDGEWSWTALQIHDGDTPAGPMHAVFVSTADGPIEGAGRTLTLTGSQETNGTVFAAGMTQSVGPNHHSAGRVEVTVAFESCGLVVGDWITPLEAISDTGGLDESLSGSFAAAYP